MDYRKFALDDLRALEYRKSSIENITQRIVSINAKLIGLKASSSDKLPVKGGGNSAEDRIINCIVEKDRLILSMKTVNPLIEITEKGLKSLTDEQKYILLKFATDRRKNVADELSRQLNMSRATVYRIKDDALRIFTISMYGIVDV